MSLGVTLVVAGILGVVLGLVVVLLIVVAVVVVAGVALVVDTRRVVTLSGKAVGLGATLEAVVCRGDQDGGGVVVMVVETSTLPVTGSAVSVITPTVRGLRVVVATSGGVVVETVVRVVSVIPGTGGGVTSFLVVVGSISAVIVPVVALAVVAVTEDDVKNVAVGLNVTGRIGTVVVLVVGTSYRRVPGVTLGEVFAEEV